jgi:AcrR family transcriptional regulator
MAKLESGIGRRRRAALESSSSDYVEKRARILKAAAEAFAERGYYRTKFEDIARRVGMGRASLYYYVGGKSDLFEVIAMAPAEKNVSEIEAISRTELAPDIKLRNAIENLMQSFEDEYPNLYVYIREYGRQAELGPKRDKRMIEIQRRYDAAFASILHSGNEAGIFSSALPTRELGYSIVGMVAWSNVWFRPGRQVSGFEIGNGLASLVLNGISVSGSKRRKSTA